MKTQTEIVAELANIVKVLSETLVDNPEQVDVRAMETSQSILLEVRVARDDLGKIIGRQGNNVRSLRTIVFAVGAKYKKRVIVDIVE